MPKAGVVGGIFGLLLIGVIVYFSLGFDQQTCEVCMDFQGRTQCRTASGVNEQMAADCQRQCLCLSCVQQKT